MTNVLLDMFDTNERLRNMKSKKVKKQVPHPADSRYETLKADLFLIDAKSEEYAVLKTYFDMTSISGQMLDAWRVDRQGEGKRFETFDDIDNRRRLWQGTNLAVVAPIITSGLRIMPHSGDCVGGRYIPCLYAEEEFCLYTWIWLKMFVYVPL